jgi:hypothetical protein
MAAFYSGRDGQRPLIASAFAAAVEVYLLGRVAPLHPWMARAVGAGVIVTMTAVGLLVWFVVVIATADCSPNAYECPL